MSKKSFFLYSVLLAVVVVLSQIRSVYAQPPTDLGYKPGELIVRFAPKAKGLQRTKGERNNVLRAINAGSVKHSYKLVAGLSVVKLPAGLTVENALKRFENRGEILYAEPNFRLKAISTIPNDTRFDELWGMNNAGQTIYSPRVPAGESGTIDADIDAPEAWDIHTGSYDIVVAVIDTGVDYLHPDLSGNIWVNELELNGDPNSDDDGNGYVDDIYGYDFSNYDSDPTDDNYHGTHVAGTIGAVGNNSEGVAGVCWNVKIMAVKFLDSGGGGWIDDAIKSVEYAVDNGATVLNNSWGGGGYTQALKDAILDAEDKGVLFVAAAGNDGANTDWDPRYPASYDLDNIISVMATDQKDVRSIWPEYNASSCYGQISVDLAAPGSNILSTFPTYETGAMANNSFSTDYEIIDGTSMAAPHVSGACALVWSLYPTLSHLEVKEIILESVDRLDSLNGLCVSEGRLNLYNALTAAYPLEFYKGDDIDPNSGGVDPSDPNNSTITYTIDYGGHPVTNPNDPNYVGALEDVVIVDYLPEEVYFIAIGSDPNYNMFAHTYTWQIGTLEPGEDGSVSLTVEVGPNAEPLSLLENLAVIYTDIGNGYARTETKVKCWGGDIVYVDRNAGGQYRIGTSWAYAYDDLQTALARTKKCSDDSHAHEIWVADGVYRPAVVGGDINISFELIDGVGMYGGFTGAETSRQERDFVRNKTYLSGNISAGPTDPNSKYVVTAGDGISDSTMLDGFIIINAATAGIYCADTPSDPNQTDFDIQPVIANCVVAANSGDGIYCRYAEPTIYNCIIAENGLCGINDSNDLGLSVDGCVVFSNGGSGISFGSGVSSAVTNTWIHHNADDGIACNGSGGAVTIRNNTIVYNDGFGVSNNGLSPDVSNCIIWGNALGDLYGCSATYSCFDNGAGGEGNIADDPLFAYSDPDSYNFHLDPLSPCVDAGDNAEVGAGETDIDGDARIAGDHVDIGADEVVCDDVSNSVDWTADGIVNFKDFAILAGAWLSHDPNDPVADPNHPDFVSDPNAPGYIDPAWFADWDGRCDFNADYDVDLADLAHFTIESYWLWEACWGSWAGGIWRMSSGDYGYSEPGGTSGSTVLTNNAPELIQSEASMARQLENAREIIDWLEELWEDEEARETVDAKAREEFVDVMYDWVEYHEALYEDKYPLHP